MYIDHRGLPGKQRLEWSRIMAPLAHRIMRGRALAPKAVDFSLSLLGSCEALKGLLSHLVSSNFTFQDERNSRSV